MRPLGLSARRVPRRSRGATEGRHGASCQRRVAVTGSAGQISKSLSHRILDTSKTGASHPFFRTECLRGGQKDAGLGDISY